MRAYIALTFLLAALPVASLEPLDAAQKRCFCIKLAEPGSLPPYFLARMDSQECRGRKLDFTKNRTAFNMGLLKCEDLSACLETPPKEKSNREAAMRKLNSVTKAAKACCPKDKEGCDKACLAKLEPDLNKAKARSARLEQKALRRQDNCIAGKRMVQAPAGPATEPETPKQPL